MCRNGDIYMAQLDEEAEGSLQAGLRPVLVVSNDKANRYSPIINIIPITSKLGKKKLPTHVRLKGCGLVRQSVILAEQITSINKSRLIRYMGSIKKTEYEGKVKQAIGVQLNL